jgi:hypothetical protein
LEDVVVSAESIRELWEMVDDWGRLPVMSVCRSNTHHDWSLLVQVPWCRFAREVYTEQHYWDLIGKLEQWTTEQLADGADPVDLERRVQQLGPEFRRDGHEAEMAAADAAVQYDGLPSPSKDVPRRTGKSVVQEETQAAATGDGWLF